MSDLFNTKAGQLRNTLGFEPNTPLWKRVPKKDEQGNLLSDFMMLIPGLKSRSTAQISKTLDALSAVLARYGHVVVFADMNMQLNLLWISFRPTPGVFQELPVAIKEAVPEAVLVASHVH